MFNSRSIIELVAEFLNNFINILTLYETYIIVLFIIKSEKKLDTYVFLMFNKKTINSM